MRVLRGLQKLVGSAAAGTSGTREGNWGDEDPRDWHGSGVVGNLVEGWHAEVSCGVDAESWQN